MKTLFSILMIIMMIVLVMIIIKEILQEDIYYKCDIDEEVSLKYDLWSLLMYIKGKTKKQIHIKEPNFNKLVNDIKQYKEDRKEEVKENEIQEV